MWELWETFQFPEWPTCFSQTAFVQPKSENPKTLHVPSEMKNRKSKGLRLIIKMAAAWEMFVSQSDTNVYHAVLISAVLPCRPECWWAWSQKCNLKESSSRSGAESPVWRGPVGHSGNFPTHRKADMRRGCDTWRAGEADVFMWASSHHHKLAQLEYLGELVTHAERQGKWSVTVTRLD